MVFKYLAVPLVAFGVLAPAAAIGAPAINSVLGEQAAAIPLIQVRDGEEHSGANPHNRWGGWQGDHYYDRGVYYGPRYRTHGYYNDGPAVGLGLTPHPYGYGYGPSFGIYVNP